MDQWTARLQRAYGDVFTAAQAATLGVDGDRLRALTAAGQLRRLRHGGYRIVGSDPGVLTSPTRVNTRADPAWAARVEPLRARVRLILLQHPRCVASHQSALLLHGLPVWGLRPLPVHLAVLDGKVRVRSRRDDVRIAPAPPGARRVVVDGQGCVDPVTASLQVAAAGDLDAAVCAGDALVHAGAATADQFATVAAGWGRRRGSRTAGRVAALIDGRSESPGETRLRLILQRLGVVAAPQVWIDVDGQHYRVDFLIEGFRIVVEFDGRSKYENTAAGSGGSDRRESLWTEKKREDALRRQYAVIRVTWNDLTPGGVQHLLEAGMAESRRRFPHVHLGAQADTA